jgi:acetyltransferase-like isoleucine patch superfamily enzyme
MSPVHITAEVSSTALLAEGVVIWQHAYVGEGCIVGENVIIGKGAYIGKGVKVGANSKIQNYALIYEPAELKVGVFIGPGAILTNDAYPRAINPNGSQKNVKDWEMVGVAIGEGASIGAGAICVAPVKIGRWAMIASGAVVTRDVPNYALMAGVPARQIGWVGASGFTLIKVGDLYVCPETRQTYEIKDEKLEEIV